MSYSNSGRSENSLLFDPYQEKVYEAVFMVNELVKNDKHFIRNTPDVFKSHVKELKTTQNFEQDAGKDEILDDLISYLTPEYEKMIRQKLNQKPASPVTPPKKTPPKRKRRVSLREMTAAVGKNKKSKKSKKKSKRNNKRKPSKKK